ncbi:MAG: DUF3800 domain-containing protein [Desulfarculaceae bacterium]|nr:DUF3800 domain-containing protein [Desulfarculaceae bacterium]
MKFAYFDESGKGDLLVMAGVIVDAYRMHITKEIWNDFLSNVSKALGKEITEFHTKDFYSGNGPWRQVSGDKRSDVMDSIVKWWLRRKHSLVVSAVDLNLFSTHQARHGLLSPWQAVALHCVLALQRNHQTIKSNKGHTVLIFDHQVREADKFCDLLNSPPNWTDSYYGLVGDGTQLNQIIDVPYFADSERALLIQIADLAAYLIRRHIELEDGIEPEKYQDESVKVSKWVNQLCSCCLPRACLYRRTNHCVASEIFRDMAPDAIKNLI